MWQINVAICDASGRQGGKRFGVRKITMTYYGGWFVGSHMVHRDVIGVAHGKESIDCAILVATHRVDDGVPIKSKEGKK